MWTNFESIERQVEKNDFNLPTSAESWLTRSHSVEDLVLGDEGSCPVEVVEVLKAAVPWRLSRF